MAEEDDIPIHDPITGPEWRIYKVTVMTVVANIADEDQVEAALNEAALRLMTTLVGKQPAVLLDEHPKVRKRLTSD